MRLGDRLAHCRGGPGGCPSRGLSGPDFCPPDGSVGLVSFFVSGLPGFVALGSLAGGSAIMTRYAALARPESY